MGKEERSMQCSSNLLLQPLEVAENNKYANLSQYCESKAGGGELLVSTGALSMVGSPKMPGSNMPQHGR